MTDNYRKLCQLIMQAHELLEDSFWDQPERCELGDDIRGELEDIHRRLTALPSRLKR